MPHHALASAPPPAPRHPSDCYRVALVCLGNICRSPTAEVVLRRELAEAGLSGRVEVDSSGTGDWHLGRPMDPRARTELAARGYDGSAHRARQFERSWFRDYDLVVAMDRHNLADLRRMAPDRETARDRIRLFRSFDPALAGDLAAGQRGDSYGGDVPDPYHGSAAGYALAFDLVRAAARGLAAQLAALIGRPAADGSMRARAGVTGGAADDASAARSAAARSAADGGAADDGAGAARGAADGGAADDGACDGGGGNGGDGSGGDGTAPGHR